ncbi:MAG: cd [Candidatus Saccharibacteria bacterium]|nr:cd [Candidatus Saccharibacteria bacterium]
MSNSVWPDNAIFIVAPRELSVRRFTQIVKHYLPKGDIVLGISAEEYVDGFQNQPQFKMLKQETVQTVIDKVQSSHSLNKILPFVYAQSDLEKIVKDLHSNQRVLLVNGSWKYAFHNLPAYSILQENKVPVKFISPFTDENEAIEYEKSHTPTLDLPKKGTMLSEKQMSDIGELAATESFDYSFQTGVAVGKKRDNDYEFLLSSFNKVIPYQSYALHHGNSRERHLTRPHDTNHYDTIHAEMAAIIDAAKRGIDLEGATMFVNLLPCPNCARTLSQTGISDFVYRHDHSGGYASELLKLCGKKVRQQS